MDDECQNVECTHDEPNLVYFCPVCSYFSLIVRRVSSSESVVGYDPLCGITIYGLKVPE